MDDEKNFTPLTDEENRGKKWKKIEKITFCDGIVLCRQQQHTMNDKIGRNTFFTWWTKGFIIPCGFNIQYSPFDRLWKGFFVLNDETKSIFDSIRPICKTQAGFGRKICRLKFAIVS